MCKTSVLLCFFTAIVIASNAAASATNDADIRARNDVPPPIPNVGCNCFTPKQQKFYENNAVVAAKKYGKSSNQYADAILPLAVIAYSKLEYDKALSYYDQVLTIKQKLLGENSSEVADLHVARSRVLQSQGKLTEAKSEVQKALATVQRNAQGDGVVASNALEQMGLVYVATEPSYQKARDCFEKALQIRKSKLGDTDRATVHVLDDEISGLAVNGPKPLAEKRLHEAIQAHTKVDGPQSWQTAWSKQVYASYLFFQLKRKEQARSVLEEALGAREKAVGPEHPSLQRMLAFYSQVLDACGDATRAKIVRDRLAKIAAAGDDKAGTETTTKQK